MDESKRGSKRIMDERQRQEMWQHVREGSKDLLVLRKGQDTRRPGAKKDAGKRISMQVTNRTTATAMKCMTQMTIFKLGANRTNVNPSSGRKRSPGKVSENNKHVHRHRSLALRRSRVPSSQKPSEVKDNGAKV